ncbi:GGDEF domain-containing protein [Pullulanibacillus sp. KACC 23026]|uniref:GGDEF domain-containing protein n=1 Tax=Pullulanibacillus sp. KACC 23026 TaxID=3028315 RepID=UPI0023B0EA58|nr:GGDEF domain-containing protein [Pullulanibacillus sp. KACC 23026]WEG12926.1 GGDEF domain-containing protein [Pullulanibacillus sp. KACC 23026]
MKKKFVYKHNAIEETLFIYLLLFLLVICPIHLIMNLFLHYPISADYKWIAASLFCFLAFWLVLKKMAIEKIKFIVFIAIVYMIVSKIGVTSGQHVPSSAFYVFLGIVLVNFLYSGVVNWTLSVLQLLMFLTFSIWSPSNGYILPSVLSRSEYRDPFFEILIVMFAATIFLCSYSNALRKERQKLEEKNLVLERLSKVDDLTGLYNRRFLFQYIESCNKSEQQVSLLLLDIDNFKSINDHFGHETGDKVLKQFAECLSNGVKGIGTAGRYGGDEFLVIIENAETHQLKDLALELLNQIHSFPYPHDIRLSVSGGIAILDGDKSLNDVLASADRLLYNVKRTGKNNILLSGDASPVAL